MNRVFILRDAAIRDRAVAAVGELAISDPPAELVIRPHRNIRSLEQNAKLWALLHEVADQVEWYGKKLSPESWKEIFSASLKKQTAVPSIDGDSFVILGASTSRMTVGEMSNMIELILAFGTERGVKFADMVEFDERHV